jgi:hypothetical protein
MGIPLWFITDNEDRTTKKLKSLGYQVTDRTVLTYRVKTGAQPRPLTSHWPPETVGDMLAWQSTLDPRCRRKIHERIKEGERKKANGVLIVIESPLMTYGFVVLYDRQRPVQKSKLADRRDSSYGLKVMPISVVRIDDRYLAQRNIPKSKTLAGKNLADQWDAARSADICRICWSRPGRGHAAENSRWWISIAFSRKTSGAIAWDSQTCCRTKPRPWRKSSSRLAPGAEIRALPVDVRQAQLGELDLLIDATGEESLGHWLCGHYPPPMPMLSVWIEGPGTAVRALLKTNASGACYRCLWHSNRRGELRSTIDPLPTILAGHGCEGLYVPFPASVSVHAASLGAEMTLDWVNGVYSPALRTRLIDRAHQLATCDARLRSTSGSGECPLCNS